MSETKHTPGPWFFEGRRVKARCSHGVAWTIAKVGRILENDEQHESNAHLIEAAPDMFAALEDLLPEIECRCPADYLDRGLHEPNSLCHHVGPVKAAIAKAKGVNYE